MRNNFIYHLLGIALFFSHLSATAEDIDLFVGAPPTTPDPANILFVVDNTANWSSTNSDGDAIFISEQAVLVDTFTNLDTNADGSAKFNIGLMLATETGSGNSGDSGGYIRAAIRPMSTANKALYATMFNTLDQNKDKSNGGKSGLQMAEAYRYFDGGVPYAGNSKDKADYTGNDGNFHSSASTAAMETAMAAIYALSDNAKSSNSAANYNSPIAAGSCGKNYVVYISNGANQQNNSANTTTNSMLAAEGGDTTEIPISPTGSQSNPSDEWASFMKTSAHEITTYTIDVDKVTSGQGPGWTALLKSMAGVSGGRYYDVNSASGGSELSDALNTVLSEILSVNSVFASVSLPVSVNTQGTYLNQVFVGLFRPDANAFPRWDGNLKQYKLGILDNKLKLLDADDAGAINNQTGFLTECARSYWTPTTQDSYWIFKPQGNCLVEANSADSNFPDGNIVEKGAAAYELRSTVSRTVKSCSATFASCTSLVDFTSSVATQAALGAADTTERDELIRWQYGLDVDDENINGDTLTEMRPSAHGDVVHSRPVAINYGTNASPEVVVYYGANDGMLHAINGNRTDDFGGVDAGGELWSFVPPEFFSQIKRIRDNTTQVDYLGNTTVTPAPLPKPYGMDGSVTGYKDASDYYIYAAMRRGGRVLYAFDVTTPANPTLKWKKGCPNNFPTSGAVSDADCTAGFSGIGQTWSSPQVFTASGYSGGSSPLLIIGGGYDTCEDYDALTAGGANHSCTASTKGNKVYLMNADTGGLLQTFNTDRSVVGDVFVVRDFNEGSNSWEPAEYAYVADMGGNIYRISGVDANTPFASTAPGSWTITKIASLGCSGISTCTANRKFMFTPDIVIGVEVLTLYWLVPAIARSRSQVMPPPVLLPIAFL